jgi:hypothetical protein
MEIKRHSQLYAVECSQSTINSMRSQESRRRLKVLLFGGWPYNYSITSNVSPETTQGDRPACRIENSGANLYRQN